MLKHMTYHVTTGTDCGWKVKEEKASRASSSQDTKAEALDRAKELAKNQEIGQDIVKKMNMKIQTENTYGNDPYPPKGYKYAKQ